MRYKARRKRKRKNIAKKWVKSIGESTSTDDLTDPLAIKFSTNVAMAAIKKFLADAMAEWVERYTVESTEQKTVGQPEPETNWVEVRKKPRRIDLD